MALRGTLGSSLRSPAEGEGHERSVAVSWPRARRVALSVSAESPQCTHTALFKAGEGQAPVHSRPQGFMQMSFVVDDIMVGSGLV